MISLYALLLAVTTAVHGRISDLVGVRTPLLVGVGLMAGGAVAAAFAPTYPMLLLARLLQGAGAAAVPVLGVAALSARYDGAVRDLALGRLAGWSAVVACLGPLVGGLTEHLLGWRAVLALPALGLLVLPLLWPALGSTGSGAELDIPGALLVGLTAAGLVLLVQSPSTGVVVALVGAVLLVLGAPVTARRVRRRPDGFLPLVVVSDPAVVRSAVAAAAVPAAWFGLLIAVPAVLVADGWEPWQVGTLLVPSALVAMVVPRLTGPMLSRIGPSRSLAVSASSASVALLVAAFGVGLDHVTVIAVAVVLVTFAFLLGQLPAHLLADDRLEVADHRRIGVRAGHGADAIERVADVGHPVAQRVVHRVLQRAAPRGHRNDLGPQQLHAEHVGGLARDIGLAHIDNARHVEKSAHGGGGGAVATGPWQG